MNKSNLTKIYTFITVYYLPEIPTQMTFPLFFFQWRPVCFQRSFREDVLNLFLFELQSRKRRILHVFRFMKISVSKMISKESVHLWGNTITKEEFHTIFTLRPQGGAPNWTSSKRLVKWTKPAKNKKEMTEFRDLWQKTREKNEQKQETIEENTKKYHKNDAKWRHTKLQKTQKKLETGQSMKDKTYELWRN